MEAPYPSLEDLEAVAKMAFKTLPDELSRHVRDVVIRIADFAEDDILRDMGLGSPFDLLGLYQGISLDQKSVSYSPQDVDMIFLYRRPILDYCADTGEDMAHVVRHVLIHEIGHHFGLSDADMDRIERQDS